MNPRILIAATGSGCGKTTITIALLKALSMRGLKVASFKCGPDYIDPIFHRKTLGIPAYNLDPFFCDKEKMNRVLFNGQYKKDIAVIEGVMGYYDGYGSDGKASTWEVADVTNTPVILIVNAKGMSNSIGAILRGFTSYKSEHHIKGVIFNNTSKGMYTMLSEIAKKEGLVPLGFIPYISELTLQSRHLGLVTADEILDIQNTIDELGKIAIECLDIDSIIKISKECNLEKESIRSKPDNNKNSEPIDDISGIIQDKSCNGSIEKDNGSCVEKLVKLAVAKDEAFCFIYQDNLDILKEYGCEIKFFSPLADEKLPDDIDGIYIPGGYPEIYADKLSENLNMINAVSGAIKKGIPTIAECGGFMYLHEELEGKQMVGVIKGTATKQSKLVRFGYGTMRATEDGMLLKKDDCIRIHEFHYYDSENNGEAFEITKASNGAKYNCAYSSETLYAGYPHLYFRANENVVKNFVRAMNDYRG